MSKVLLIDDDPGISQSLGMYLVESGFDVRSCLDGAKAMDEFRDYNPDIVILDINLPGMDGIEICGKMRDMASTPILMLSARDDEKNIIKCLDLGADDYVSKPFSPAEIIGRIKAILRRGGVKTEEDALVYKEISLNEAEMKATYKGEESDLTKSEFYILKKIVEAQGSIVKREDLMKEIMGYSNYIVDRTIDTHIKNIRKKLGDDVVVTVRGVGYKVD